MRAARSGPASGVVLLFGNSHHGKFALDVFVRTGRIWVLRVRGQEIRTTGEHPFFVLGKGWVEVLKLEVGDMLLSHDGKWSEVEEVFDTGEFDRVFNLRVAEFSTYFVGCAEWERLGQSWKEAWVGDKPGTL